MPNKDTTQKLFTPSEIETIVKQYISEHTDVALENLSGTDNLHKDLGADSLDDVEFIQYAETTFGIEIYDEDIGAIKTVDNVINLIENVLRRENRLSTGTDVQNQNKPNIDTNQMETILFASVDPQRLLYNIKRYTGLEIPLITLQAIHTYEDYLNLFHYKKVKETKKRRN